MIRTRWIHGIPVLGTTTELKSIAPKVKAEEALIAIPSANAEQMRAIVVRCKESKIPFKTVPSMGELINGKVTVKAIRDVDYRDLLGREAIRLEEDLIGAYLKNARVLVTGAGGSIGSELCRQICRFRPASVILYERGESALYEMELELKRNFPYIDVIPVLGDIRDRSQLSHAFSDFRPQVVFHAAAYKHVPMLELQPWKAIKNNILGTRNMIDISRQYAVERFVLVSTDKAVRPTNIMGASKRVAELLVQGQNGFNSSDTRFMIVRFGNVVGSVGSVLPLFKKQIETGGPVTITHPEVSRYFMTIPEACQLILQAGSMGKGGESFLLDMGTPIKIQQMARDLIRLSGFEPEVDIKIEYIGLRPGEKLHEELITEGEGIVPTNHEKIMVLRGNARDQVPLNGKVDELARLARQQQAEAIRSKLQEILPEYSPTPAKERSGSVHSGLFEPMPNQELQITPG
jgi:FlaA1/EpsC-like NDP-sugar epimerase